MPGVPHRDERGSLQAWDPTDDTVGGIDRELSDLHRRIFHPGNMIVAVSGDDPEQLKQKLAAAFSGWETGEAVPDEPAPESMASCVSHGEGHPAGQGDDRHAQHHP